VDVEREWRFSHQDLVAAGSPAACRSADFRSIASVSAITAPPSSASSAASGTASVSPGSARTRRCSYSTRIPGEPANQIPGTANTAAALLETTWELTGHYTDFTSGHIILLELQRVHPTTGYNIPVEWWWTISWRSRPPRRAD